MLKVKFLILSAVLSLKLTAQFSTEIIREPWQAVPALSVLPPVLAAEPAVIVSELRRIEYIDEGDGQEQYRTLHKRIHINDDRGIESFNKIYLPVAENKMIVDIRARTILPGGKVIELDKNDIKEIKEDDRLYKIFALEGLVKGCEVEYMYTYHSNLNYFGREILQGNFHILDSRLEIVSPQRLVFDTRIFNSSVAASDTVSQNRKVITIVEKDIPAAEEEKYSMYTANLKRVEYKLSYNKARNASERIYTWNALAKNMYASIATMSDKEAKRMQAVVEQNRWKKLGSEVEKIVAVENYLKKNISTRENVFNEQADNVEWILKNKICTHRGMMRLFSAALTSLDIPHEYVLTGSRSDFTLDKTFENWINCDNYLIYFPASGKYLAPTVAAVRYPFIDPDWGGAVGVFCKKTTIGSYTSGIGYVRTIDLEDPLQSRSDIHATVSLNGGLDALVIDEKQISSGYFCSSIRSAFSNSSSDDQQQLIRHVIKESMGTEKILNSSIEHADFESFVGNKPFVLNAKVEAPALVERAGDRILIRFGELIGPQVQMYTEKQRRSPVELPFGHVLERKISLVVPEGYRIRNPGDLTINSVHKDGEELTMGFVSNYKLDGANLEVHVLEQYLKTYYPIEQYDPFQKIINAAADFNKIVLVLEKI